MNMEIIREIYPSASDTIGQIELREIKAEHKEKIWLSIRGE